MSVKPYISKK